MLWSGLILTVTTGLSLLGTTCVASAACSNIQCKCALQNGGTFNPSTNRWSMHGCSPVQMAAFTDCISRGASKGGVHHHSSTAGQAAVQASQVGGLAVQTQNQNIRDSIQRKTKQSKVGRPHG
jgi:hypothetical protein